MERIYHVYILKIRRGRLIGKVDRMLKRKIPYGEGFEFGIPCRTPALVLMIKLGKAGGKLSASGAGSRDHNKRPGGFNIIVFAVALRAYDGVYIGGIILYGIVRIMPHAHHFQPPAEGLQLRFGRCTA